MAEYIEYHPLKFWLDPASIAEIVAHIQSYLVANPINSTTEIETIIHDYLIAHPELIGGVDSVNGETGEVILTAENINSGENVTIKDVLDSLQNQIDDIVASIPSDYHQLINDVSDLKSQFNNNNNWINNVVSTIEQGNLTVTGRNGDSSSSPYNYRLRSKDFMLCSKTVMFSCVCSVAVEYAVSFYTKPSYNIDRFSNIDWVSNGTEVNVPDNAPYIRITIRKESGASITPSDISDVKIITPNITEAYNELKKIEPLAENAEVIFDADLDPDIEQGGLTNSGINTNPGHSNYDYRIRSVDFIVGIGTVKVSFGVVNPALQFSVSFYEKADYTQNRTSATDWNNSGSTLSIPYGSQYMRLLFKKTDGSAITPQDLTNLSVEIGSIVGTLNKNALIAGNNYAIDSALTRRYVSPVLIGELKYLQSFCIYGGKYYSTNGSYIAKQDSSFTLESDTEISVGHGNSMQIGTAHPDYVYISGWDDQKVYVVDLDTISIVETIAIPTTGYTTVAVDDVNKIMYIFQRDSTPSTEAIYNFIVYDYDNETVLSTKKIQRAFAAMQAVEFCEGKIYVLNGLGTNVAPNYYLVYNTAGDVISEYVMGDFSTVEPEGVYIDRATKELYMSFVDKKIYKVI